MKVTDFNGLIEKIEQSLVGKSKKFHLPFYHYTFNDSVKCEGISFVFTGNNVTVETYKLYNLVHDSQGSRFLSSETLTNSYYLLTSTQFSNLTKLLNQKY